MQNQLEKPSDTVQVKYYTGGLAAAVSKQPMILESLDISQYFIKLLLQQWSPLHHLCQTCF